MVDALDVGAAVTVVLLQQQVPPLHLVVELQGDAEGIVHVQRPALGVPVDESRPAAGAVIEGFGTVQVGVSGDLEGDAVHDRCVRLRQDQRMVVAFLHAAQIERVPCVVLADVPQQVDIEVAGVVQVRHPPLRVAGADDVEGRGRIRCGKGHDASSYLPSFGTGWCSRAMSMFFVSM